MKNSTPRHQNELYRSLRRNWVIAAADGGGGPRGDGGSGSKLFSGRAGTRAHQTPSTDLGINWTTAIYGFIPSAWFNKPLVPVLSHHLPSWMLPTWSRLSPSGCIWPRLKTPLLPLLSFPCRTLALPSRNQSERHHLKPVTWFRRPPPPSEARADSLTFPVFLSRFPLASLSLALFVVPASSVPVVVSPPLFFHSSMLRLNFIDPTVEKLTCYSEV